MMAKNSKKQDRTMQGIKKIFARERGLGLVAKPSTAVS